MTFYEGRTNIKGLFQKIVDHIKSSNTWEVHEILNGGLTANHSSGVNVNEGGITKKISFSAVSNSGYTGEKAFNKYIIEADYWSSTNNDSNPWLQYDFGVPTVVNLYSIVSRTNLNNYQSIYSYSPKKWKLVAKEFPDSEEWITLHEVSDEELVNYERRFYKFENEIPYQIYRIEIEENNHLNNNSVHITDMEFYNTNSESKTTGILLKSNGSRGNDNLNIILKEGDLGQEEGLYLEVSFMEDFDLESYKSTNYFGDSFFLSSAGTNNTEYTDLDYMLDINKDRIILTSSLEQSATNTGNHMLYVGLPKRVSNEEDSSAMLIGKSQNSFNNNAFNVMRNKVGFPYAPLEPIYLSHNYSPSIWDDYIFLSPLFLEGQYEGIRGQIDGVYTCRAENLSNYDEVDIDGSRYRILILTPSSTTTSSFPMNCVLVKIN